MAKKIDIEIVQMVLKRAMLTELQQSQILEDIKFEATQIAGDDREPRVKRKPFIIVSDPLGRLTDVGWHFATFVLDAQENIKSEEILPRLHRAVADFNCTPQGRYMPIKNVYEACQFCSPKILKEYKIWMKAKEPVPVIVTDGKIAEFKD